MASTTDVDQFPPETPYGHARDPRGRTNERGSPPARSLVRYSDSSSARIRSIALRASVAIEWIWSRSYSSASMTPSLSAPFARMRLARSLRSYVRSYAIRFVPSFGVRGAGGFPPPVRSVLLRSSTGRSLREMLANGRRLLRIEHPSRVLVLGRPREVRAEIRANELTADVQLVRDRFRARVLDSRHVPSSRSFDCHDLIVASIERANAYAL